MNLPTPVRYCMEKLERAGFCAYAVGGCVRDTLLGRTPHDYDLCTDASPQQMRDVFAEHRLVCSGEKHGTVGVVLDGAVYEITTFRTEGGYADGRHPDWVRFVGSIEEDLARRDFTVNAMAYSPKTGYVDPWGGRRDLENKVLRAVGEPERRFREDALRILRGVRFAVRYQLTPEETTRKAMFSLAPLMDRLARERVFDELCKLLPAVNGEDLLRFAPVLTQVIPELAPAVGFSQRSPHHAYDVFTHKAYVVENVPPVLPLRWAALLHDVGKAGTFTLDENGRGHFRGHAEAGAELADAILLRLRAPTALRTHVVFLVKHHMLPLEADKRLLRRRIGKYGADAVRDLLTLQRADFSGKGTGVPGEDAAFEQVEAVFREVLEENACLGMKDLAVNGRDLIGLGFAPGPRIGQCLEQLLQRVQDELLLNEKETLLEAAREYRGAE